MGLELWFLLPTLARPFAEQKNARIDYVNRDYVLFECTGAD